MLGSRIDKVLVIPATLLAGDIDRLVAEIRRIAEPGSCVTLDCSAIEQVGSDKIALLCQLVHCCSEEKRAVTLGMVTPKLERVLKVLDLHEFLMKGEICEPETDSKRIVLPSIQPQPNFREDFGPSYQEWENTMDRFRSFLGSTLSNDVDACELEIVFYEIVTNIRLHAGLKPSEKIRCGVTINGGVARLHFTDPGKPFDPTGKLIDYRPVEFVRSGSTRGLGLTMVQRMVGKMTYRRENGTLNVLTMEKRLRNHDPLESIGVFERSGNAVVIDTDTALDNDNAQEMIKALTMAGESSAKFAIVNMSRLERISSAGAGAILGYVSQFRQNGGDIVLCNVSANVRHVLNVLDLTEYLTIKADVTKAQEYCRTFE